jgi:flavodoxin
MMRALIVFESMFGNTEAVAGAIAEGMGSLASVTVVPVGTAPDVVGPEIGLLVVGGPTHAFGMSRHSTRTDAVKQGAMPVTPVDQGLREWLERASISATTAVATFDTRVLKAHLPGSAARAALRQLRQHKLTAIGPATSFAVGGTRGPLDAGELDRARAWGESLAATAMKRSPDIAAPGTDAAAPGR